MKKLLRAAYAKTPQPVRIAYNRLWRLRAAADRMFTREDEVNQRLAATNLFFLLGSGRCGTQLISGMLNRDPGALVLHEPHRYADVGTRARARRSETFAREYVQSFRKYEIYRKIRERNAGAYGEVSSPLRCLGAALQEALPHAKFMILVRDPREAVRSAMNRQIRKKGDLNAYKWNHEPVTPLPDDPYEREWESMTPFEKFCWWWMDSYEMLFKHLPEAPVIQFEGVIREWSYVRDRIVEPIGLNLTESDWQASVSRKSDNAAPTYVVDQFQDWPDEQREAFVRICGETMEKLGYSMDRATTIQT